MFKKVYLSSIFLLFSLFLFSPLAFANEEEDIVIELELNLDDLEYVEVSEEEVISDYMRGHGVDRDTAKEALGINDMALMSSCSTTWRHYSTPRVRIDSLSSSYLTVRPYIQVETCANNFRSFKSVSSSPNYVLDDPLNAIRFDGPIQAELSGSNRVQVAAMGHVRNPFGIKLRNWSFNSIIYAMNEIG